LRARKVFSAVLISVLTILLILIVSSRNAEKVNWPTTLSSGTDVSGYEQTAVPDLDNDTSNIAQSEITPTPVPNRSLRSINPKLYSFMAVCSRHQDNPMEVSTNCVSVEVGPYFDSGLSMPW
jgi:hypothetical protein